MDRQQRNRWLFTGVNVIAIGLMLYVTSRFATSTAPKQVSYSEFLTELRAGNLTDVQITEHELIGISKSKSDASHPKSTNELTIKTTRLPRVDESLLLKELDSRPVKFGGHIEQSSWVWSVFGWLFPLLFIVLIYGVGMRRIAQGSGPLTFGKNRAKIHDESSRMQVTFQDVAGVDEAKLELEEVVDFLRQPAKYQKLGGRIPKGVLLVGPPGTGKTLLAKAVAGEARVSFFSISGSEFVEMFVGVGAARVRDLFEQAKQKAPCIVFIDELDAIGKARSSGRAIGFSNDEREQTLNQLLAEIDGFDTSEGVIIMAATNTPEVLDPALLRAGRFDRQVLVDRPDLKDRVEILKVHARKILMSDKVTLETIAARTPGMVGADLANIINEAALLAVRHGGERVEMHDLEEAVDRVMLGLEKKSRVMSPEEKERVSVHEAGHALVALSVKHADPLHRVSIIPRSIGALGYTLQLPTQERYLMTQPELEDQIAVLLGGRTAEEIHYSGVISTGAADDLERASALVRQMVTRFGMSDALGPLTYGRSMAAQFLKSPFDMEERNYSGPVQIPAVHQPGFGVLPPGTYVFKVVGSASNRHIVQIFSKDELTVYATILAIPNLRMKATDKTVITFRERPAGQPEALRAWFYPGKEWGEEFVYPKAQAFELAKSTSTPVLEMPATVTVEAAKPEEPRVIAELQRAPVTAVEPSGKEVEMAQVVTSPPAAETLVAKAEPAPELPKSASPLPLIGLIGLLTLAGGLTLRVARARAL